MSVEITADMVIHDVVTKYPQTVKVFQGHGLPCTACQVGARESVAAGARTHRLDADSLVRDLNLVANGQEAEGIKPVKKAPVGRGIPLTMAGSGQDAKIRHIVAVMSGKGGVGKSLVTGLLAVALQRQGLKVGILDGDITGPSIAKEFGVRGMPQKSESEDGGIEPLRSVGGVKIMSMNMFLPESTDPVVWRGPMVSSAIKQFYSDADWGKLDFLLVDLPPGTSDAPMTVMQSLPLDGVVIVSSPQMLATEIVMKCIKMVQTLKGRLLGIVENMAYLTMPDGSRNELFGPSNGAELVAMTGAPLLAQLPIDRDIAMLCDAGHLEDYHSEEFNTLATNFLKALSIAGKRA